MKRGSKGPVAHNKRHGESQGGGRTVEYHIWEAMTQRCRNPRASGYAGYGARGIAVCERWLTYENFLADVGRRPSPRHSLDRRDNDGDYSPENVRWATPKEQARNRRTTRMLTCGGVTRCLAEWAEFSGINMKALHLRLKRGWPIERAIAEPLRAIRWAR